MNKDAVLLGDVYGKMLNTFKYRNNLTESAAKPFDKAYKGEDLVGDGPEVDGVHKALKDEEGKKPIKSKKKTKENVVPEEDEEYEIHQQNKKIAGKTLNKFMSKSVFDKLYNKVLKENFGQEEDALGLGDATPDSALDDFGGGDDDFGDEDTGEDSVTFTLPREVAQQLVDVLQGVLGDVEDDLGGDEDLDFGDEGGDDDFGGDDEFGGFDEDEETQGTKVAPDKKQVFQNKNNKVTSKVAPKSGKASSDVTDDTNTTQGAPPITALQGKSNQVPGSKVKVGDFFK